MLQHCGFDFSQRCRSQCCYCFCCWFSAVQATFSALLIVNLPSFASAFAVEQLCAEGEDIGLERVAALLLESFEEVFRVSATQPPRLEEAFLDEDYK